MSLTIARNDLPQVRSLLRDIGRQQVPFAAVVAMTRAAQAAKVDLLAGMSASFDRPTRWTMNSLYVEPATKQKPEANVHFKDHAKRGVPAGRFLRAQILGGTRALKSFERRIGLEPGYIAVPGRWADLDGHGNLSRGQLNALAAQLGYLRVAPGGARYGGAGPARRRGVRRHEEYFVVHTRANDAERTSFGLPGTRNDATAHLPPGIYRVGDSALHGGAPLLVMAFVRQYPSSYKPNFDFVGIGTKAVETHMPRLLTEAMRQGFGRARQL